MNKNFMKQVVSLFTSILMIFSCVSGLITASAETQTYNLGDGGIKATLDDNGMFTVIGTGDMPTYTANNRPYFSDITKITNVVINSGITSIGNMSFINCSNLVKADIADTVTSIGTSTFMNCKLENLVIDIKGTLKTVGSNAFGQVKGTINVYNKATYDLVKPKATQATINLLADTSTLKEDLQKLITETRESYKQEDYTEASYKTLSDALTKAETLVSQASPSTEEIQNATKAINDAVSNLVSVVEGLKTELQSAIDEARKIVTTTYTTSTVAALNKAISDAEAAINESGVTKEKLTQAMTALETASKVDETGLAETGLKVKASLEGLSRRDKAISTAKQSGEGYTVDSYANYKKVYDKLYELLNKSDDITDAQIDSIIAELEAAEKQLEPVEIVLNTKEYEAIKKEIEDILNNDNSPYTEKSLRGSEGLKSIYDLQRSFVEDELGKIKDGILQGRIDTVVDILRRSIDPIDSSCVLVKKGDVTVLKTLVDSTKDFIEANYTEDTWKALSDKVAEAEALINDPDNAAKSDVEAAEQALKNAINALKEKPTKPSSPDNTSKNPSNNITSPTNAISHSNKVTLVSKNKSAAKKAMNKAKIKKLTIKGKVKKIIVTWKKVSKAKGYQVQVSTNKKFKKNKIVLTKNTKNKKITIKKKIKSGKTYYVRVRAYATYKNSKGITKKAYSSWNKKLRTVKIK